jgi:hypothetical protein
MRASSVACLLLPVFGCAAAGGNSVPSCHRAADAPATFNPATAKKADQETDEQLRACIPGSTEHQSATEALSRIDLKIAALGITSDPKPIEEEVREALRLPCLALAESDAPAFDADSGYALKTWWKDGGQWWLSHYLNELITPRTDATFPTVVLAPSIRTTLTLETRPDFALRDILCSIADKKCALETRGWRLRAEQSMRSFSELQHAVRLNGDPNKAAAPSLETCIAQAPVGPREARYDQWRACLSSVKARVSLLPQGDIKSPTQGWLVLQGRRGHYQFCDELRAYDLETGSAYIAQSCSGLALQSDGSVNGTKTNAGRKVKAQVGTLPLDALREAAWMMLLTAEVQNDVTTAWGYALPEGVEPMSKDRALRGGFHFAMNSGQTTLAWAYAPNGAKVLEGTLTWPANENSAGEAHAVSLLQIAEAALTSKCPSARIPAALTFKGATPVLATLVTMLRNASTAQCVK